MTMAVGNVAQERLSKRFDKWDANGDGVLEPSDFVTEAANIARAFGETPESEKGVQLRDGFIAMFENLAQRAGVAPQGPIDRAQFLQAAGEVVEGGAATFNPVLGPVTKGIVALADKNGDGVIDDGEFAVWLQVLGLGEEEGREAFQQIDTDKSGTLSEDELLEAIRLFHTGDLDYELLG
ncbi:MULTISPECIES: EF-hand domain-containing protein [unclassified Streptomyces]|uniref:EF-hand domain-containing protein n=1 Tax=unclassified Streptomyces TaxID=2593676 RepID=UPI001660AEA1|nr:MULTISPECIES: EF-hand domain-containing protein [unclassified Streptomyces]MBD0710635.1 signal transduction protein [Streptomyces sp. CBMA291]MBD0715482.1 signal transduction protein [Streptomyces sp. CBMA370]